MRDIRLGFNVLLQRVKEIGPILRRFFINTLFDSTFTQLGIIMGSAFAANPDLRIIIGTLVASSVALGISTGVSVYESERLERERRIVELEKALFRDLKDTVISEKYGKYVLIVSVVNFFTPLICCSIVIIPLLLAELQLLNLITASWISVALALALLFLAGTYLGRLGKQNPFWKGTRMVIFGVAAFGIGYIIQILI
jgi:predicted membrane protein (TIGR00267 family)